MIINGRKIKAKDLAKQAGVSRSTVIKYYGISREEYEREAAEKRKLAFNLRSSGLKWK
ncbi:plasmid replication protein, partial [Salmonella enterica]|nr:plasmid replication protein [Salmonella enterica]